MQQLKGLDGQLRVLGDSRRDLPSGLVGRWTRRTGCRRNSCHNAIVRTGGAEPPLYLSMDHTCTQCIVILLFRSVQRSEPKPSRYLSTASNLDKFRR